MNKYYSINFAQAYGQDTYSACIYNDTTSCTTAGGSASSSSGSGSLTDTGMMIALFVTLACLIIFGALIVRIWRRPKKLAVQEVDAAAQVDTTKR